MQPPLRELPLPRPGILAIDFYENYELHRYEPPEDLRPFVVHIWTQRTRKTVTVQPLEIQTGPETYLFINDQKAIVHGIFSKDFQYNPTDNKVYAGVKFKAGGFQAFYKQPMYRLAGTTLQAETVFPELNKMFRRKLPTLTDEQIVIYLTQVLQSKSPHLNKSMQNVQTIMALIHADRSIQSVHTLAERYGKSKRTLELVFRDCVGVSPKWVLRRKRLADTLLRMQTTQTTWATLVADSGYTDQSHFSREFKSITGINPREYKKMLKAVDSSQT